MMCFGVHGLQDIVQQGGQQAHPNEPHCTLSSEYLYRIKCIGLLRLTSCTSNQKYWQNSELSARKLVTTFESVLKFDCMPSFENQVAILNINQIQLNLSLLSVSAIPSTMSYVFGKDIHWRFTCSLYFAITSEIHFKFIVPL